MGLIAKIGKKTGISVIGIPTNPVEGFIFGWGVGNAIYEWVFDPQPLITDRREQDAIRLHQLKRETEDKEIELRH